MTDDIDRAVTAALSYHPPVSSETILRGQALARLDDAMALGRGINEALRFARSTGTRWEDL